MRSSRRDFLKLSATALGALSAARADPPSSSPAPPQPRFNVPYQGTRLNRVAFPLGGIGAGMICLEGTGALSQVSVRNHPDVENEPCAFAAVAIVGRTAAARVLEGPVPGWKLFGLRGSANGGAGKSYGLPRFAQAGFTARFPFATVTLAEPGYPLQASVTGWSPFTPGDADASSLPVAALEYRFENPSAETVDAVFSYNARNFMVPPLPDGTPWDAPPPPQAVRTAPGGFLLWAGATAGHPTDEGAFVAAVDDPAVRVNHAWFRGGWWDPLTMAWEDVARAACFDRPPVEGGGPSPGASLFVPFRLGPGESRTIALRLCWHVPTTQLREGVDPPPAPGAAPMPATYYRPWYADRFPDVLSVAAAWREQYRQLRGRTEAFARCFHDSSLPPEVMEAVAANLSILKSPTVLRQTDGRLWAWEGCGDDAGCCHGSCTHVWNYAQATAHLFPALERTLRETEFGPSQDARGHQVFRAALPIRPQVHDFHAAADGQLGGIMKVHRDWRISGDTEWLRRLWPKVRQSLDYCIETWDPEGRGWVEEPHHNTYDVEFWGPDGMCTSFYLGALTAAVAMGEALGEPVPRYASLLAAGRERMENELFDGEYFIQRIEWRNLRAKNPQTAASYGGDYSPEAEALLQREGPKYQYGTGCLSDGVLGAWIAQVCGVSAFLAPAKVASHLQAVHRHNFKTDLSTHANPQRPTYACGREGGLLLCTWPKGGALSLPFVYSNEVWTGIEYQVASHLIMTGRLAEGLEIVRACRARYDGRIRNPFDEYECGHWYARALSSYALLQALSGARYDAIDQVLHLAPALGGDFRCFFAAQSGYGLVGVRNGQPFCDVHAGTIPVARIAYRPAQPANSDGE